jgi:SAM-dependent methyltransferase
MKNFFESMLNPDSATTQITTTTSSYAKVAEFLLDVVPSDSSILDYGAGLGMGTSRMREILKPKNITVHSYEPFPKDNIPDYLSSSDISEKYDAVVNLNVLNVVERDLRDEIVTQIISILKEDGIAIIGTRAWRGDIDGVKNFEEGPEPKSVYVLKKKDGGTIKVLQKGFDGNDLKDYIQLFTSKPVTNLGKRFAASSVIVGNYEQEP